MDVASGGFGNQIIVWGRTVFLGQVEEPLREPVEVQRVCGDLYNHDKFKDKKIRATRNLPIRLHGSAQSPAAFGGTVFEAPESQRGSHGPGHFCIRSG